MFKFSSTFLAPLLLLLGSLASPATAQEQEKGPDAALLQTVAERTQYQATSRYDDVMSFCLRLAEKSPLVHLDSMGLTHEGRSLPLLIIADPPLETANQARQSKRLVVLAIGNIHAGEVCGKEALMMLARDLTEQEHPELLRNLVLVFAPIYNADGNERVSTRNRPRQNGPAEGAGQRENAQGLDLNRDYMKLESLEARALAHVMTEWDPAIFLDLHTTNGSYHRYGLTYDSPRHPGTDAELARWVREDFLGDVSHRLEQETGYRSFFYGNFDRQHQRWDSYPAQPRFGTHYAGLRSQIGILSEAYAYASFQDRVLATYGFVKQCLTVADAQHDQIAKLRKAAKQAFAEAPRTDQPEQVPLRWKDAAWKEVVIPGFEEEVEGGRRTATDVPRDYACMYYGLTEATLSVARPYAYIVPAQFREAIENLIRHGIEVEILREDIELDAERYRITDAKRDGRGFQGHQLLELEAESSAVQAMIPAGSAVVKTTQPLGRLAVQLLEPQAPDGLAAWNFFDGALREGADFPVLRLPAETDLLTAEFQLPYEGPKIPLTSDQVSGRGRGGARLGGAPLGGMRWMDDDHYLLTRGNRLWKVNARSGRSQPLEFDSSKVAAALQTLPEMQPAEARRLAQSAFRRPDPKRLDAILSHQGDLYYVQLDGSLAVRLTKEKGDEELEEISPDGTRVAFVRDNDLHVVDLATQTETRLTEGGSPILRRGKADWVYFEEIYQRNWKAFKWSPDSQHIAFQEFDDSGVKEFTVLNHLKIEQDVEEDRYPLAGQTNPVVRLGLAGIDGAIVRWIDFGASYPPDETLITRFQWAPDGRQLLVYLQDRAQRWLDVVSVDAQSGEVQVLFRDQTSAWVEDPGDVHFLQDASFLIFSERDGWRHLYRYSLAGELMQPVTQGPWEVRSLEKVDEQQQAIWVRGTRDSSLANNLYRVDLQDGQVQRLTSADGDHSVRLNPSATLFVDTNSSRRTPDQVRLFDGKGQLVRTLDINPVPDLERYTLGKLEFVRIPTRDGFELDASLILPPDLDPSRKYPVWLQTYAGPHAPTLSDSWSRGRGQEQVLANMGIIAFRVDPRSASGKSVAATWTAYRQLGVQELEDLEDAVKWLRQRGYVDPDRIGISGHSYGGFMTAYAMTHSKLFAAGIAGAPVTDWRNYDTIYTERYMDTPQNNPEGYKKSSVVEAAENLHGRLLLIHGARDDNVHLANTLQLVHALQGANRDFELMIYPNNRHGIFGAHYQRLMTDFIRRTMLPTPP